MYFRFHTYPELTLEQINKPENTSLSLNAGKLFHYYQGFF